MELVKPQFILKKEKDIFKIIEKNEALHSTNIDKETLERMRSKETGAKLALRVKEAISSGEYDFFFKN